MDPVPTQQAQERVDGVDVDCLPLSGVPQGLSRGAVPSFAVQIHTSRFSQQGKKAVPGEGTFLATATAPEGRWTGSGGWGRQWVQNLLVTTVRRRLVVTEVTRTQSSSGTPMATASLMAGSADFLRASGVSGADFHLSIEKKSTDLLSRDPDH